MIVMKIKKLVKSVALVAILSLTGCMLGPDFKKPVIKTDDSYRFADKEAETMEALKWWELFNDPVLGSLVNAALQDNKDIRIMASKIEEARASLGFTRADAYPRLDLEASASRGNSSGGRKMGYTDNHFFIAPVLRWEIDFWGKFRRATEASMAELMASEYALRTVQIGLISEVVNTYFLLLDFNKRLEISRETLASRIEGLDIIEKRFSRGIIPEIDVNQAQIQKETAAIAIPIYERLISQAEHKLSILLGRMPGEIEKGMGLYSQTIPPDIPAGLPSSLLERRPDIVRAEHLLEAQSAKIGIAQALRLPSIGLTGLLGGASDELSSLTSGGAAWSVTASILGPIFNFNQDKMQVEIEKEKTKQALYQYENTVLLAFGEVEDALNEIHTYKRQISAIEKKFKAAKNAATLSEMRYDKGVVSFLEVLDTQRELFAVELELSETKQEFYNAYVKLYKALGGGWIAKEASEKTPNFHENLFKKN